MIQVYKSTVVMNEPIFTPTERIIMSSVMPHRLGMPLTTSLSKLYYYSIIRLCQRHAGCGQKMLSIPCVHTRETRWGKSDFT
jgi:hypothetical protein